jgi:hypothetical protein
VFLRTRKQNKEHMGTNWISEKEGKLTEHLQQLAREKKAK